jgi:hypothetical protein
MAAADEKEKCSGRDEAFLTVLTFLDLFRSKMHPAKPKNVINEPV